MKIWKLLFEKSYFINPLFVQKWIEIGTYVDGYENVVGLKCVVTHYTFEII